jgi:SlyX protein
MDERLTELEIKLSFQERTIEQLNEALVGQQAQLDQQQKRLTALEARLSSLLSATD